MMILLGIFLILHGLVHLLYAGHSLRFFELRPNMTWPNNAWLLSKLFGDETTRHLAAGALVLAGLVFAVSGLGLFFLQDWSRALVVAAAACSSVIFIMLWGGKRQSLDEQGGVGLLINIAILGVVSILN